MGTEQGKGFFLWADWAREHVPPGGTLGLGCENGIPLLFVSRGEEWEDGDTAWRIEDGLPVPQEVVVVNRDAKWRAFPGGRCGHCGLPASADGTDPCLGRLEVEGLVGACCGHGVNEPYLALEDASSPQREFRGDAARAWFRERGREVPQEGVGNTVTAWRVLRLADGGLLDDSEAFAEIVGGVPGGPDAFGRPLFGPSPGGEWALEDLLARLSEAPDELVEEAMVAYLAAVRDASRRGTHCRVKLRLPFPGFEALHEAWLADLRASGWSDEPGEDPEDSDA